MMSWRTKEFESFRTGLTWGEVYESLRAECASGRRTHVTRATVLGKWHEIKLAMWADRQSEQEWYNELACGRAPASSQINVNERE
jgi:hypothetical protein